MISPQLKEAKDDLGLTGLHWAFKRGFVKLLSLLILKHDMSVEARDLFGRTPINLAVRHK